MNKRACLRGSRGDSRGKGGSLTTEWFREHKEPVVQRGADVPNDLVSVSADGQLASPYCLIDHRPYHGGARQPEPMPRLTHFGAVAAPGSKPPASPTVRSGARPAVISC
jgi:hypothetical protein